MSLEGAALGPSLPGNGVRRPSRSAGRARLPHVVILTAFALAAGAVCPQAWGDDPPVPPATTSAPEPVTVPSPQPAAEPAPKPDPAPQVGVLRPPAPQPSAPPPSVSPQPAQAAPPAAAAPNRKHRGHKKKRHSNAPPGSDRPRPTREPIGGVITHADSTDAPPAADDGTIVAGSGGPLQADRGGARRVLFALLFMTLGLAIALFGLAAVPARPRINELVAALVATRRVELAAAGALTLAASATLLAAISLTS